MHLKEDNQAKPRSPYEWMAHEVPLVPELSPLLDTQAAAKTLRVCPTTIRRMIRRGTIRASRLAGARGRYRVPRSEVERVSALQEKKS